MARKIFLECDYLVKVQGSVWKSQNIQIYEDSIHLLNSNYVVELCMEKECVLAFSLLNNNLNITAIPKLDNRRKCVEMKINGEEEDILNLEAALTSLGFRCSRRKIVVFINPFSGTGRAMDKWRQVCSMLEKAGVQAQEIVTESTNHAYEVVQKINLNQFDGVVTVSGDGLIHEVLNGLTSREDWDSLSSTLALGIVPGGSGNAIHCSLLHQQLEDFRDELLVAALNIARGSAVAGDYIDCQTDTKRFSSLFGVAWGLIPDCDIGSEVIRWAGFMRAYLWLVFRIMKPRTYSGVVSYLQHKQGVSVDPELPALGDPVPDTWTSVKGSFLTVYACKQSWLDYKTLIIPQARLNDGIIHLVMISGEVSRLEWIRFLVNPDDPHLRDNITAIQIIPVTAFRFKMDSADDPLTVDAEKLTCSTVQGKIKHNGCKILLKDNL